MQPYQKHLLLPQYRKLDYEVGQILHLKAECSQFFFKQYFIKKSRAFA